MEHNIYYLLFGIRYQATAILAAKLAGEKNAPLKENKYSAPKGH